MKSELAEILRPVLGEVSIENLTTLTGGASRTTWGKAVRPPFARRARLAALKPGISPATSAQVIPRSDRRASRAAWIRCVSKRRIRFAGRSGSGAVSGGVTVAVMVGSLSRAAIPSVTEL